MFLLLRFSKERHDGSAGSHLFTPLNTSSSSEKEGENRSERCKPERRGENSSNKDRKSEKRGRKGGREGRDDLSASERVQESKREGEEEDVSGMSRSRRWLHPVASLSMQEHVSTTQPQPQLGLQDP